MIIMHTQNILVCIEDQDYHTNRNLGIIEANSIITKYLEY